MKHITEPKESKRNKQSFPKQRRVSCAWGPLQPPCKPVLGPMSPMAVPPRFAKKAAVDERVAASSPGWHQETITVTPSSNPFNPFESKHNTWIYDLTHIYSVYFNGIEKTKYIYIYLYFWYILHLVTSVYICSTLFTSQYTTKWMGLALDTKRRGSGMLWPSIK